MKALLSKLQNFWIFFLCANLYLVLSNIPLGILAAKTPPDRIFTFDHISYVSMDYSVYLSVITQGAHGSWLMRDVYTTEPTNPTTFYIFYILLGKIVPITGLSSIAVYHIARIVGAQFYFLALYWLCRRTLGSKIGFWASVIAIGATISPPFLFGEKGVFTDYYPWWSFQDALKRLGTMPHYLFAYALLFLSVVFIDKYVHKPKPVYFIACLVSIVLGGILVPSSMLPVIIGVPLAYGISVFANSIKHHALTINWKKTLGLMLIVGYTAIPLLLAWRENFNGFPWDAWWKDDVVRWNSMPTFNRGLVLTFGLLPLMAIPAVLNALKTGSFTFLFVATWAFLPYLLLPFANALGIAKIRLIYQAPFIPFAILSAHTLTLMAKRSPVVTSARNVFIAVLVVLNIAVTGYVLFRDIQRAKDYPAYLNVYIPVPAWRTFGYINTHVPKDSVVLGDWFTGNILPAYAPVVTVAGHTQHTKDFFTKKYFMERFYRNQMTSEEALAFLSAQRVSYVFFGLGEMEFSASLTYPFLLPVYVDEPYTLYTVRYPTTAP